MADPRYQPENFKPDGYTPDNYLPGVTSGGGPAGYYLYSQPTLDADAVKTLVAKLDPGTDEYTFTGDSDSVQYLFVRVVNEQGVGDGEAVRPKLRRVAFDGSGNLIPDVPNAPISLSITPASGGTFELTWFVKRNGEAAAPATFNIYLATGATAFDFDTVDDTVTYSGGKSGTYTTGAYADGTTVRAVVRAASGGGGEEPNETEVSAVADATAPAMPSDLTIKLID